jgi:4-hydroxybenzoate polyprenyltransferase
MIRTWLELARISNLPTVWTNVTAGWLLAGGSLQNLTLGWMLLAGSLLYTGGMILNDAADAKFDAEHRRERPIPSGRATLTAAWAIGFSLLIIGWCVAVVLGGACWGITSALVGCILLYDFYHKPWVAAIWVMGACRVLLYLMPGMPCQTAACIPWWLPVGLPALALGAYIVGLTIVARMEATGLPISFWRSGLARLLLWMPGILAAVMLFDGQRLRLVLILADFRPLLPLIFIFFFAAIVAMASRIMKQGGPAIGHAVGILLAGIPVVDALAVSQISLPLAFGFMALAPLLRLWQRWIAAT